MSGRSARRVALMVVLMFSGLMIGGCGAGGDKAAAPPASVAWAEGPSGQAGMGQLPPIPAPPPVPVSGREGPGLLASGQSANSPARPDPGGTLYLEAGWNLMSFGLGHLEGVTADPGVHPTLFTYDATEGSYRPVELSAEALNASGPGLGYWAYAAQAARLLYQGSGSATRADLQAGWNLVGYPGSAVRLADTCACASGGGAPEALSEAVSPAVPAPAGRLAYSKAFSYSPSAGQYQVVDLAEAGGRTTPGRSIWVYAHAPATVRWYPGPYTRLGLPGWGPPAAGGDQPPPSGTPSYPSPPDPWVGSGPTPQ